LVALTLQPATPPLHLRAAQPFAALGFPFNIPGWVVTVTKQAVPLSGCPFLHFKGWLGSAVPPVGAAHSIIFGSGGEMRFGVSTHHSSLLMFVIRLVGGVGFCVCGVFIRPPGLPAASPAPPGPRVPPPGFWVYPAPPATYLAFIFRLLLKIAVS